MLFFLLLVELLFGREDIDSCSFWVISKRFAISSSMRLFHYTDAKSHESILQDKLIHQTKGKHGLGVYLTTLDPSKHDAEEIARNNYGRDAKHKMEKVDHYIDVEVEENHPLLEQKHPKAGNDVWVYRESLPESMWKTKGGACESWCPLLLGLALIGVGLTTLATSNNENGRIEYDPNRMHLEMARITAEQEQRMANARKRKEEAKQARAIVDSARNLSLSMKHVRPAERCKPSEFVASTNVGEKVDRLVNESPRVPACLLIALLVLGLTQLATKLLVACLVLALSVFVRIIPSPPSKEAFEKHLVLYLGRVVNEEDLRLFRNKPRTFMDTLKSFIRTSNPVAALDHKVRFSEKLFGHVRIASVSLGLVAGDEIIERNYYWIGAFGFWHAVTMFDYHVSVPTNE